MRVLVLQLFNNKCDARNIFNRGYYLLIQGEIMVMDEEQVEKMKSVTSSIVRKSYKAIITCTDKYSTTSEICT